MTKKVFLLVCVLSGAFAMAQNAISGHVNMKDIAAWQQKVHLVKMDGEETKVTTVPIKKDGTFSFHKKYISDKNTMYRMYVNRVQKIINDTIAKEKVFILSNTDSVRFEKGNLLFSSYKNTNVADAEWRKLVSFQGHLMAQEQNIEDSISEAYAAKLKSYTKDSLKILMVKLIGVQQLENKNLLDTDIAQNSSYYLALLNELQESKLDPSEYLFLQKKLAYLTQDVVEEKYQWSKAINILLGLVIAGLLFFVLRLKRKKKHVPIDLSKQERNIQGLILEGKSNKEIANELFISISTVKTHITNIYSKLKVSNREELVRKTQN